MNARTAPTFVRVAILAVLTFTGANDAVGQKNPSPSTGPVVDGFGPVYDIEDPDVVTPAGPLRAIFDVTESGSAPGELNRRIESVARFLNMHARAGVDPDDLHVVLILHGGAGKDALSDAGYGARHGMANPNLPLLEALAEAGVDVVLCGQTMSARGFGRNELAAPVKVALSAMTAMLLYQARGYGIAAM